MKGRKFSSKATHHIYQRCKDHGVLFYTEEDRIVYYTLAACKAKKHKIKVSAASLMYTHIHQSLTASSREAVQGYLHDTNTSFSRLYNFRYRRSGELFERHPGQSQKITSKDIRSNLVYVFNNHVEKGLSSRAVEERWAFLAYAVSTHPFSEAISRNNVSRTLRRYLNLVDRRVSHMKALEYSDLDRIFASLSKVEREQFIDYVISAYALIDYSVAISHFGSTKSMILAIDSTTGGEYEIKEDYTRLKDTGYKDLLEHAEKGGFLKDIFIMDDSEKMDRIVFCSKVLSSHTTHLKKFFHIEFSTSRR